MEQAGLAGLGRGLWTGAMAGLLSRIRRGRLEVSLPDGSTRVFSGTEPGIAAEIRVRDWAFFPRVVLGGDVGFGEAYEDGQWDSGDLAGTLRMLLENEDALRESSRAAAWLGRLGNRLAHLARRNTRSGSRRNIRDHYDLGNEFFSLFLDPSMMYSCAVFREPGESLRQAQANKLAMVIEKARLGPRDHVLEIGGGWGSFAVTAAKETGCRVTSLTLSERQLEAARERAREEGVADRVRFELRDYRDAVGAYDAVVSIEMIEAVGHEFLPAYFGAIDRLLKPEGRALIQAITMPDSRYEAYRRSCDWIQKRIFPGAVVPSLAAMAQAMARGSSLMVERLENIGPNYARTLRLWRERLEARKDALARLGFDGRFLRAWRYYFAYCEAGFSAGVLGTLQMTLTRARGRSLAWEPASGPRAAGAAC